MAAGCADGVGRRNDAWSCDVSVLNALFQSDIVKVGGTHVANGREARFQGALGVRHSDDGPEIIGELKLPVGAPCEATAVMRPSVTVICGRSSTRPVMTSTMRSAVTTTVSAYEEVVMRRASTVKAVVQFFMYSPWAKLGRVACVHG